MDKGHRFLHNHPMTEKRLGLDEQHVIVDRDAWEEVRKQVLNLGIPRVRHFQFLSSNSGNEIIEELDTDMHPPIKGQYVWLKTGVRFQVTAVHHDYHNRTLKIYCA